MGKTHPVIGIILIVAITVILAAVVACFVFGWGHTIPDKEPNTECRIYDLYSNDEAKNNIMYYDENGTIVTIHYLDGQYYRNCPYPGSKVEICDFGNYHYTYLVHEGVLHG